MALEAPSGGRLDGAPANLVAVLRGDPERFPERLVLLAVARLGPATRDWARATRRAALDSSPAGLSEAVRTRTARLARVDGAISGTPFLLALVPAYVTILWEQARMVLRVAALNGHDPTTRLAAAEILALRGLYDTPAAALSALDAMGGARAPRNGRFRPWMRLGHRVLVLAGFLSPRDPDDARGRGAKALAGVAGAALWIVSWVLPLTFMLMMSWGCESSTRRLGTDALEFYGGPHASDARYHRSRRSDRPGRGELVRWVLVVVSIGVPLAVIGAAIVTHARGQGLLGFLAPLLGLSVVFALAAHVRR